MTDLKLLLLQKITRSYLTVLQEMFSYSFINVILLSSK